MDEQDGITAYHGSPHEFEQFDISKIGTGEGAQAYGHGLYFAEHEPTAKYYRNLQANKATPSWYDFKNPIHSMARHLAMGLNDEDIHAIYGDEDKNKFQNNLTEAKKLLPHFGHMYEVHIDAHPDHFLDWDKPLSDQSPHIMKSLIEHRKENPTMWEKIKPHLDSDETAGTIYQHLAAGHPHGYAGASEWLQRAGIHGIRYVDANSRGSTEKPTHNYVVFDHDRVNIKRRYAEGGEVEREGFGFGGDTVGAGSGPVRGATGSASAARAAREAPQPSYRDMPAELQQAQRDLSFKNEQVINAMKEANAADKQQKAEQMTAWAGAGFPSGGPNLMQVGEETRPTAYAMSDISKKSPVMQSQADIIASLAPPAGTPTQGYEPIAKAAGTPTSGYNLAQAAGTPTNGYNPIAQAAGTPTSGYNLLAQAAGTPTSGYNPIAQAAGTPTSGYNAPQPIKLAALDSSTFKTASPMPDFQPQTQDRGPRRRLVKKLMPDGTYQDVWEEYAHGGVAKYRSYHHNSPIIEHALGKVGAPPPAFGQSLSVAKRGRPL